MLKINYFGLSHKGHYFIAILNTNTHQVTHYLVRQDFAPFSRSIHIVPAINVSLQAHSAPESGETRCVITEEVRSVKQIDRLLSAVEDGAHYPKGFRKSLRMMKNKMEVGVFGQCREGLRMMSFNMEEKVPAECQQGFIMSEDNEEVHEEFLECPRVMKQNIKLPGQFRFFSVGPKKMAILAVAQSYPIEIREFLNECLSSNAKKHFSSDLRNVMKEHKVLFGALSKLARECPEKFQNILHECAESISDFAPTVPRSL